MISDLFIHGGENKLKLFFCISDFSFTISCLSDNCSYSLWQQQRKISISCCALPFTFNQYFLWRAFPKSFLHTLYFFLNYILRDMDIKVPVPNELQTYLCKKTKKELGLKFYNFIFYRFCKRIKM